MNMEELRSRHKTLQNTAHHIALECIHSQVSGPVQFDELVCFCHLYMSVHCGCTCCCQQSTYGSPYHVHPYPSPVRLQHAFQNPPTNASPKMFHPKGLKPHFEARANSTPSDSPILGRALCLTPRGSPLPGRVSHLTDKFQDSVTLTSNTDALVAKISAMFPTVSETHIKILLKKYYNREAVVISALQVEKHPITTPGPLGMSPRAGRLQRSAAGVVSAVHLARAASAHLTPLTGTPHGSPSLVRPASGASSCYGTPRSLEGNTARHQSPKMKLKYLKSIFPKAEETIILDVLANRDNNVQKASEELLSLGYPKKETIVNKQTPKKTEKDTPLQPKKVVTIMRTMVEKNALKQNMQKKYSSIPERVVAIALESVDYNEEHAEQILDSVAQEPPAQAAARPPAQPRRPPADQPARALMEAGPGAPPPRRERSQARRAPPPARAPPATTSALAPRAPAVTRLKAWADQLKPILKATSSVVTEPKYQSHYSKQSLGPTPGLSKGPKDGLLLEDYMAWNGPNPVLRSAPTVRPEGPEPREIKLSLARGPSPGLAKGPAGLAKGSIYQKITKKTAKMCFY